MWAEYQVYVAQNKSTLKLTYATVVNSVVNVYQDGSFDCYCRYAEDRRYEYTR